MQSRDLRTEKITDNKNKGKQLMQHYHELTGQDRLSQNKTQATVYGSNKKLSGHEVSCAQRQVLWP
jgi:predicted FMN-binding regulatory protein PaiB